MSHCDGTAENDGRLFQTDFPPAEFAARREKIYDAIGPGSLAVLQGAGPVRGFEVFRQSNDFYYACGVETPGACLLLNGSTRRATLLLAHRDPARASEGEVLTAEDAELACRLTGVDAVRGVEALAVLCQAAKVLYTPLEPAEGRWGSRDVLRWSDGCVAGDPWDGRLSREQHFAQLLRQRLPRAELRDLSPILDDLRGLKSPAEMTRLREAGRLSARAIVEAMRVSAPGIYEYQFGAVADYVFAVAGARGAGYRHIIAGGANAWYSHYFRNNCPVADGELVLMDCAPDCGYYTSDIGRMWPVNGVYSPVHRELYGFMVHYHKALLARIRPGVLAAAIMDETAAEMAEVIERTRFSKDIYAQAARRTLAFRGHLSHPVGMSVHDVCSYYGKPLEAGVVFTVDPQMWVPEERLYIRCEDTVAVTGDGMENLTVDAPLDLDDVERFLRTERRPLPMMD